MNALICKNQILTAVSHRPRVFSWPQTLFQWWLLSALVLFGSWTQAEVKIPALTGPVVDEYGLFSGNQKSQIEQDLLNFRNQYKSQIQVLVLKSLEGDSIERVAIRVFDQWKLGDEKRDDGVLFLIAPAERKLRIEVGQGLEGTIPDVIAKRIIADVVRPYFQRGEYFQGTQVGLSALKNAITSELGSTADFNGQASVQKSGAAQTGTRRDGRWNNFVFIGLFGIWLIIFLISPRTGIEILLVAMSRGGRSGGYSGGASWGGGGGRSSGGGASGGW